MKKFKFSLDKLKSYKEQIKKREENTLASLRAEQRDKLHEKEELLKRGLNDSVSHVDFMVGTSDLSIIAITNDGREVEIFKDGDWCI